MASRVMAKYTKDVLIGKLWAAQCTECDSERMEAEYDDADDPAGSDASYRPDLVANSSSNGSGSDGV